MVQCRLCDSTQLEYLFSKGDAPFYRCAYCGFIFQTPEVNPNLVSDLQGFDPAYLQYLEHSQEDRRNFEHLLGWLNRFRPIQGRVLDVGAGSGKFVRYLRSLPVEAFGVEPSQALFQSYLADEPFFVNGTIENCVESGSLGQFDIITALDVLEHVEYPKQFLKAISSMLTSNGIVCISTPDVKSVCARVLKKHWHFFNRWHLSYLSEDVLSQICRDLNLRVIGSVRMGRLRSLRYIVQYFLDFVAGSERVSTPAGLDRFVIPINLFDTVCLCIEKRSPPGNR